MGEETTGERSGISIETEDGYAETVAKDVPLAGDAVKAHDHATSALDDGKVSTTEMGDVASDAAEFVQSCGEAGTQLASDPLGWLASQGLSFLTTVITPLQDLIHFGSGDGPALAGAAKNFTNIGNGLTGFADNYQRDADSSLANWQGPAASVARAKTMEFADGVRATADEAGNIAQLLHISSMIMTVIEDLIKALITELVRWLIMIWVPALAAAVPTCGASTAEAGAATAVKGTQTGVQAANKVSRLQKLLDKVHELMAKLKDFMARAREAIRKVHEGGALGKAGQSGVHDTASAMGTKPATLGEAMKDTATGSLKGQVTRPGKIIGNLNNVAKAGKAGQIGEQESGERPSEELDF